jgi:hypothetical protein
VGIHAHLALKLVSQSTSLFLLFCLFGGTEVSTQGLTSLVFSFGKVDVIN